eukprot:TRINITY_DN76810_c0_g1_i1.p1 TRINITY_DN76810_c0_g1~~TRINITY_DN76810_c0_g1_i1.p1  ORF type:complete len:445 (-),score=83.79 TRINITY_DN76810_c0_g1_i1:30-1364(-)
MSNDNNPIIHGNDEAANPKPSRSMMDRVDGVFDFVDSWMGHGRAPQVKNNGHAGGNAKSKADPTASKAQSNATQPSNESIERKDEESLRETAAPAGEQEGGLIESAANALDFDGDGDVDLEDLALAAQADVEGEAEDTIENLTTYRPIFLVLQMFICGALWIYGSIASTMADGLPLGDALVSLGGLETLLPGKTMVLVHGPDCEDYRWEAWRWIAYQYSHGGIAHVGMNILLLIIAGLPLEGFHGHIRIAIVFEVSVIGGALCHMISKTHGSGLVGMSAGCYSLMAMHMADLLMNWHQNRWRKLKLLALLGLIGLDVVLAQIAKPDDPTGHSAHFGGYMAGLVFGVFLVRNPKVKMCERVIQGIMLLLGLGLTGFALFWISQWAPVSIWDPEPACGALAVFQAGFDNWKCVRCIEPQCGGIFTEGIAEPATLDFCLAQGYEFMS